MPQLTNTDWKTDIHRQLIKAFENRHEKLIRVLWYLNEEEKAYIDSPDTPPVWRTLKAVLHNSKAFKSYAERMAEDTKRALRDPDFRLTMNRIYEQMMCPSDAKLDEADQQGFDLMRVVNDRDVTAVSGYLGFARAWGLIPVTSQKEIMQLIPKLIANRNVLLSLDELSSLVNKSGGVVVMVALAGVYLGYQTIKSLLRWWRGEISGCRCAKIIIDSLFIIGSGVAGGIAGAALGTVTLGPIGTIFGGIGGGILSSQAMNVLIDRLTQSLFGIPKDEAVENAYNFFGVPMTASNSQVNTAFRKLCLKHHPDKGGQSEDFYIVQLNMAVIKMARSETL